MGVRSLLSCLKNQDPSSCADKVKLAVIKRAVVLYLPAAVNEEFQEALSGWFSAQQVNAYNLKSIFKTSLTKGRTGSKILNLISNKLNKGESIDKIKKNREVTAYIFEVVSDFEAPTGLIIVEDLSDRIIQKEIDKFLANLEGNKQKGIGKKFFELGFKFLFRGEKAKKALIWKNSKNSASGQLATKEFKRIFKRVVERNSSISDSDIAKMQDFVQEAILEHRKFLRRN